MLESNIYLCENIPEMEGAEALRKPNILQTSYHHGWGGEPNHIFMLARGLSAAGCRVLVAAPRQSALFRNCQDRGIPACGLVRFSHRTNPLGLCWDSLVLRHLIQRHAIDIVHTHGSRDSWAALLGSRGTAVRLVRTRHNLKLIRAGCLNRFAYRRFSQFAVVSQAVRKQLRDTGFVPEEHIALIPDGVDLEQFNSNRNLPCLRRELGLPDNCIVITSVGRLDRDKGHRILVQAAELVVKRNPAIHFVVAGKGPEQERLTQQIIQAGLQKQFRLIGHRIDPETVYASSDIVAIPSITEGLGTAVLEAMAMMRVVVASQVGGMPDLVCDGHTGRLVPAGDAQILAEVLLALVHNPEERESLAAAGRRLIESHYSLEKLAERMLGMYSRALHSSPSSPAPFPATLEMKEIGKVVT